MQPFHPLLVTEVVRVAEPSPRPPRVRRRVRRVVGRAA